MQQSDENDKIKSGEKRLYSIFIYQLWDRNNKMVLSNANIWSANISLHGGIQTNNYADAGTAKTIL